MSNSPDATFDRRVSAELIEHLKHGWLAPLVERRHTTPALFDVQLRRDQRGTRCWATLYAGLSGILNVEEHHGKYRIRTAATYQKVGPYNPTWAGWQHADTLAGDWAQIDSFVDAIVASDVLSRYVRSEGAVHAAMCSGTDPSYSVIQREASPSYRDTATREAIRGPHEAAIHAAMAATGRTDPWWPGIRDRGKMPPMGTSVDLLAIDPDGRLLVIEAKPPNTTKGIVWAPSQVRLYAELFHHLLTTDPDSSGHIAGMLAQRQELGLTGPAPAIAQSPKIVPVVAIGAGTVSPAARTRLPEIHAALPAADHLEPTEVWFLDDAGTIIERTLP